MRLSRRHFFGLTAFGATLAVGIARGPRSLLTQLLFEPDAPLVPSHPIPPNPFTTDGHALVAVVTGEDIPEMLSEGLRLLGGVDRLGLKGKRVLVKPNLLNNRPPPTTTNPAVVAAVVAEVRRGGAADVSVADSSGMIRFPTRENFLATGMGPAAEEAGARVLCLEDEPWVGVSPDQASVLPRFLVSKPVYEADLVINVPVVKTHRFADYSCGLKNLVGIIHPRHRPSLAFLSGHWHERIAELNLAVHPALNIADATTIMIAGGPTSGTAATGNLLLFSGDRVALDVVALALLRSYGASSRILEHSIWEQRQIKRAGELGLGVRSPRELSIVGRSVGRAPGQLDDLLARLRKDIGLAEG